MRLHVHDWGPAAGRPLFCLHGVTSWGGRFRRLAEERLGAFHVFERVRSLVLLDPAVWVPPPVALERAELSRRDESYASVGEAVDARLAGNPLANRRLVAEELPQHLHLGDDGRWRARFARSAVVAAYGEMAKPPPLDRVAAPTLLVRGRDSEVVPDALVDIVCETLADCEVVTVPGGHIVMWDAFDETASAVLAFLEDSRP